MLKWFRSTASNISYLVFWILLAVLAGLTAFQFHATLISIAIAIIENPTVRPTGWSLDTIYGLSRVFWLVLGILWLGWVMFCEGYLREGKNQQSLLKRLSLLLLISGALYGSSYIVLLLLP